MLGAAGDARYIGQVHSSDLDRGLGSERDTSPSPTGCGGVGHGRVQGQTCVLWPCGAFLHVNGV
jgi:hypothetical protein